MGNCAGTLCIKDVQRVASTHEQPEVPYIRPHGIISDNCHPDPLLKDNTKSWRPEVLSLTIPQPSSALPPRPEFISFIVPNVSYTSPHDDLDFWTYPERHGWLVHVKDEQCHLLCPPGLCRRKTPHNDTYAQHSPMLSRADGTPVTGASKVSFLQGWLFFGSLLEMSKMCGLAIDIPAEFLVDGGRSVSTAALNGLSGRLFSALTREQVGCKVFMARILRIMRHIALLTNEEFAVDGAEAMFEYTQGEARIFHSIDILLRTLGLHLLLHLYSSQPAPPAVDEWGKQRLTASVDWIGRRVEGFDKLSDVVTDEMADRGWCYSELFLMDTEELIFASLLDRPRAKDHSNCGDSDVICRAYQTDEATYKTVHVKEGCDCEFVCVPNEDLVDLLSQDRVPSVIVTEELQVQVVCSDDHPYIALSHVWADGLGNPAANALPRCQLRRLRTHVIELQHLHSPTQTSRPIAFWMDTLCIPVEPRAKAFRKKAIQLLGKTFNEASAVLVLDRELEIVDAATAPFLELGIRILCSGWVKRLWTLQEAVLASEAHGEDRIFFQMRDGPFPYRKYDRDRKAAKALDDITTELQAEERELLCERGIILLLGEQIPSVRAMRAMREGWSPFRVIFNAVEHRTTSKVEDMPVCVASLVGKDVAPILAAPDAQHGLAAFYLLMREVPSGILWLERVEKLRIAPFRWAPTSVTACPATTFMGKDDAWCDERGLHVQQLGFILDTTNVREHPTNLPTRFRLVSDSGETGPPYGILWPSLRQVVIPLDPAKKLAIVIRHPAQASSEPNAAIVLVEGELDANEIACTILAYRLFSEAPPAPEGLLDAETIIRCNATGVEQKWCIT